MLTVVAMCTAGIALLVLGTWAARHAIADARGLDKIIALGPACFAAPLAPAAPAARLACRTRGRARPLP